MNASSLPHPLRGSWGAEAASLLFGLGSTAAIFLVLAFSSGGRISAPEPALVDLRVAAIPPDIPPPPPQLQVAEASMPVELAGLDLSASDSPVKIEVVPMEFEEILPDLKPPAVIKLNQIYTEFKPDLRPSEDLQHIFQQAEVDTKLVVLRRSNPKVPKWMRRGATTLEITVVFVVERNGAVGSVRVAKSSDNKDFDDAFVQCLKEEWAFSPALRRGKKVRCMAQQTFVYRWDGNSPFDT